MKKKADDTQRVKHIKWKRELPEMAKGILSTNWWNTLPQSVHSALGLCAIVAIVLGGFTYIVFTVTDPVIGNQLAMLSNLAIASVSFSVLAIILHLARCVTKMSAEISQMAQTNSVLTKWVRDLCKELRAAGKDPQSIIPEADDDLIFFDLNDNDENRVKSKFENLKIRADDYDEGSSENEGEPKSIEDTTAIGDIAENTEAAAVATDPEVPTSEADDVREYVINRRSDGVIPMLPKSELGANTLELPTTAAVHEAMKQATTAPETELEVGPESEEVSEATVVQANSQPAPEEYNLYQDATEHSVDPEILRRYLETNGYCCFDDLPRKTQRVIRRETERKRINAIGGMGDASNSTGGIDTTASA